MTAYIVTVTDHAAGEVHADPETFPTITAAKEVAESLVSHIYADMGAEVDAAVTALIERINTHRGEAVERDDYLDCTVAIVAA